MWTPLNPLPVSERLLGSWVTQPCPHSIKAPFIFHEIVEDLVQNQKIIKEDFITRCWTAGKMERAVELLTFYRGSLSFLFPLFDQGPEGPWVSCIPCFEWDRSSESGVHGVRILQRNTCLLCVIHQAEMLARRMHRGRIEFTIIPWYDRAASSQGHERPPTDFVPCQEFNGLQCGRMLDRKLEVPPCPGPAHTPYCTWRLQNIKASRLAPGQIKGIEKNEHLHVACIACVPRLCQPHMACIGCKELYKAHEFGKDANETEAGEGAAVP